MAKCPNRNLPEYKSLKEVYGNNIKTDNIINSYQKLNNTENIPTVFEAQDYVKNERAMFSLKKAEFSKALENNLAALDYVTRFNGMLLVKASKKTPNGYGYITGEKNVLEPNILKIKAALDAWGIPYGPNEIVSLVKTDKTYKIVISPENLKTKDAIPESIDNNSIKIKSIIEHFKLLFPQTNIKIVSEKEGRKIHKELRGNEKVNFKNVNSFVHEGDVFLIRERMNEEIAIEEMLHPFIDSVFFENSELYKGLLEEAKKTFPKLNIQIENDYSQAKGFSQKYRDVELVTQALSRHFKKEYEENPTQSFYDKVEELMEWFLSVIKDLHRFLTNKNIVFKTSDITKTTTLSDIAKLLNTTDIAFKFEQRASGLRYSLKPSVKKVYDHVMEKATYPAQKDIITKLANASKAAKKEVDTFSAGKNADFYDDGNFMIFNETEHKYFDFLNNLEYTSATTAIKGSFANKEERALNLAIGNDFDSILNAVLGDVLFDDIASSLEKIDIEKGRKVYLDLQERFETLTADGSVAIPQVILFDEKSTIAGTADVVIVTPAGKLKILDLKTSKNYLKSDRDNYGREFPLDDSLLRQKSDKTTISTSFQHNMQVNLYRRMLENMGYEISNAPDATSTYHIKINLTKDENGKDVFKGDYEVEGIILHPVSQNEKYVEILIPANQNTLERQKIKQKQNESEESNPFDDDEFFTEKDQEPENNKIGVTEFDVYLNALENFQIDLVKRRDLVKQRKGVSELNKTKDATIESINDMISSMELAVLQGPMAIKAEYTRVIRKAIKDVQEYTDYVLDPNNVDKPEYINYVLNFERYSLSFNGLIDLQKLKESPLSKTQANLVLTLQSKINDLKGTAKNSGIIDTAIFNYVKETVKNVSSAKFTEEDLNELLSQVRDIPGWEYMTGDMSTNRDTLLAVLDKIYKAKVQEFKDKAQIRQNLISSYASKLLKLSPGVKPEELYKFMTELDSEGLPTGFIVRKLGDKYYGKIKEIRDAMLDGDGNREQYIAITNEQEASQEDLDFNKRLYEKKKREREFWSAESTNADNEIIDGKYHKYTKEYKELRAKYATAFVYESGAIKWTKRRGVSDKAWNNFRNNNGEWKETLFAEKIDGRPTGVVTPGKMWVPFNKYRIPQEKVKEYVGGKLQTTSMTNPKYDSIMNPTDEVGKAQKEFYEFYVETMDELRAKLPQDVQDQMVGRIPIIEKNIVNKLKGEGPLFTKMWTGMKTGVKDFFTETGKFTRVLTNEKGEIENSLPIYYTGSITTEKDIKKLDDDIAALTQLRKNNKISEKKFKEEEAVLVSKRAKLRNKPTASTLSLDLGTSLRKFTAMAENFETMSSIEDTVKSFIKVVEKRDYLDSNPKVTSYEKVQGAVSGAVGGAVKAGIRLVNKRENDLKSNLERRIKKWASMVYYDNEQMTKNALDKSINGLIQYSSIAYVGTNFIGNINNLAMGKLTNAIELAGANYYDRAAYYRMKYEYNTKGLDSLIKRTAFIKGKKGFYDVEKPLTKYEGLVNLFDMLDDTTEINDSGANKESYFKKATSWAYILNTSFEYNVQTQTGMAMLDSYKARDKAGNEVSLYNAFIWDASNQEVKFNDKLYDVLIDRDGKEFKYSDEFRYELRNKIREVNKKLHGNYAYADRMVMQSHNVGKLAAQFKKWVAPAIKNRFRKEYYDENLNWVEGRYRSFASFMAYAAKNISKGRNIMEEYAKVQKEITEREGTDLGWADQKVQNKIRNVYSSLAEIGIILTTYLMKDVLAAFFAAEDDDADVVKKLKNLSRYQTDRVYKELLAFVPILGTAEAFQFIKNPLAATRSAGQLAEAVNSSFWSASSFLTLSDEEFYANKDYVYQRGKRKGSLKVTKEWADVLPYIYTIQKWSNFDKAQDFYIK